MAHLHFDVVFTEKAKGPILCPHEEGKCGNHILCTSLFLVSFYVGHWGMSCLFLSLDNMEEKRREKKVQKEAK